ncbi:MAG: hypothetical protein U5J63_03210 [Fodinibius sp.]|nr:hypothetical protein [Fodinibius sp.]
MGDMLYFKVYGGTIKPGLNLINRYNGNCGAVCRACICTQWCASGVKSTSVTTGDIGAAVKLKDTGVNDTLHAKGR